MSVIGSNILAGASGQGGGYNLTNSLRFRSSASSYLNRTPASAGNRQIFTYSVWAKRGKLGAWQDLLSAGVTTANNPRVDWTFNNNDSIEIDMNSSGTAWDCLLTTTAVYRDPSAWYHVVVAVDTTQATASNRVKLYVNGSQITSFSSSTYPAQNANMPINNTIPHGIGNYIVGSSQYYDGLFTEVNFIDGQALTPSSFGETSATTGVWQPKKYAGTYGTNGFYLPFTDNSALTTSSNVGLGKDFSGNGNYWTTNNISITAGATYDSMTDVPTLTSATASNFCVWSPINKSSSHSTANANLTATSSSYGAMCATIGVSSGKWYWEMLYSNRTSSVSPVIGFGNDLFNYTNPPSGYLGSDSNAGGLQVNNGSAAFNGGSTSYGSAISTNDLVMFAMDLDNRKFYIGKNGTWFNSGNPVTGTNEWPYSANILGSTFFPAVNMYNDTGDTNFGQRPFAYTPPTGFVALNTFNLPTPTIGATASTQANKYFDATTYTGNGSTQSIVNAAGFSPDLVWVKQRNGTGWHILTDSVRGANKQLYTNATNSEGSDTALITALNSNGFSVGYNGGTDVNGSGSSYVAWQWDANGAGVTNTAGSITSTVSANTTSGFSVVTYTGTGSAATIGHGLGVAPKMIIVKSRTTAVSWGVYHEAIGAGNRLLLDSTGASTASTAFWNSTSPTSTVFSVGTSGNTNSSGNNFVAYCFSAVAGYSAFGSYVGNGSTDGTFVATGFTPRFIMVKQSSASGENWEMYDTARGTYNLLTPDLYANLSNAEGTNSNRFDILSNGFKIRSTNGGVNTSGATYIYMAFAEVPAKFALGV